jgi:hypothetical protein
MLILLLLFVVSAKFHHITITTRDVVYSHPNITILHPSEFGMGNVPWLNLFKIKILRDYCDKIDSNDIVLLTDAHDVYTINIHDKILQDFLDFNVSLVISAEANLYPQEFDYPNKDLVFPYLNSGGLIGYAGFISSMIKNHGNLGIHKSDQRQYHKMYLNNARNIKLDRYNKIFLSMCLVKNKDLIITDKYLQHKITLGKPSIIHFNGRSFPGLVKYKSILQHLLQYEFELKLV